MLKKALLMAALALAMPLAAFASGQVDFTNAGGTLMGSSSGLSLSGSSLIFVDGFHGGGLISGSNLGSVSFTTGALTSGSLAAGGMFAAGGTFMITGNGANGLPAGTIFSGTFDQPVNWKLDAASTSTDHIYDFFAHVSGSFSNNKYVTSGAINFQIETGKNTFNGQAQLGSADTSILVPEPGTLSLFGTGILALAGIIRKKMRAS